ncbi:NTF2 [Symbiodinium pilosum]|uniref:NTF2 protein n=1 Tax=Symbiodinium pilosum TaxID=2952 RepID=A0A812W794_SYMPI|nr:NTF2 [Symbiodinium pilosum]
MRRRPDMDPRARHVSVKLDGPHIVAGHVRGCGICGVAVFYQTDVRLPGIGQVSKSYLVLHAAARVLGVRLKWHKIVHFGTVDQPTWNAIQFTHLLCFAKTKGLLRVGVGTEEDTVVDLGSTMPDILQRGPKPPGLRKAACCMGVNATASVLKWAVRRLPGVQTVIDPFCGAGTVLAIANEYGLDAIGVDISPKRIKQAKQLDGGALLGIPKVAGGKV